MLGIDYQFRRIGLVSILISLVVITGNAQERGDVQPSLSSPFMTLRTHLYYLQPETYSLTNSAMTIPESDPEVAGKLAIQLKEILDGKGLFVRMNKIPQQADFVDSASMAHYYTPFPKQLPDVYLERVDSLWRYSRETIRVVPRLHRKLYPLGADLLSERMPAVLCKRFLGLTVWQYLGIPVLILCGFTLHYILTRILRPVVALLMGRVRKHRYADPKDIQTAAKAVSVLLILYALVKVFPLLQLPIKSSQFISNALTISSIMFWMLLGLALTRIIISRIRAASATTENRMDDQLIPAGGKLAQIVIVVVAIVFTLSQLDINVAALIAGFSIGALALALAAQDTVKNLIGSLMIFVDRPFQVGDAIVADGQEGTVVEVGLRSTRIRALDTSVLSIPNGTIANITISNMGVREFRMMNITLGVTYSTTPEQIEAFTAALKSLIVNHPLTLKENYLVHFREMGDSALKILFRCFIPVHSIAEELQIREEIYLEIMRIAQRLKINFAFPSTSIYLEKNGESPFQEEAKEPGD